MMEPVEIACDESGHCACDDGRGNVSDQLYTPPYVDVELGSLPVVPLEVPEWLKIDDENHIDDTSLQSSLTSFRREIPRSTSNQRMSPNKRKAVSFRETTDVYLIPLPSPEEKRARFYTLEQIATFRLDAERAIMKQYIEDMMQRPCTNPLSHDYGDNDEQPEAVVAQKPEQDLRLHHSEAVQDNLSRLLIQENETPHEDEKHRDVEVEELVANGPPYFFVNTTRRYVKQAAKHHTVQLVTGLCIVAYVCSSY